MIENNPIIITFFRIAKFENWLKPKKLKIMLLWLFIT